jgi:hypothetical protein
MKAPIIYDPDTGRRMHAHPSPHRHADAGGVLHGDGSAAVQGRIADAGEHGHAQHDAVEDQPDTIRP